MWARGRSAAGGTAESICAKWERRSLSAPRFQVPTPSTLQTSQLWSRPEWQRSAPESQLALAALAPEEPGRRPPVCVTELRNFCPPGRGALLHPCCISAHFVTSRVRIQMRALGI